LNNPTEENGIEVERSLTLFNIIYQTAVPNFRTPLFAFVLPDNNTPNGTSSEAASAV